MNLYYWINAVALVVGSVAGGAFLYRYTTKVTAWWREEHRGHVVAFSGVVWAFYVLYTYRTLTMPAATPGLAGGWFNVVRTVLFLVLTGVVVWRWVIFERGLRSVRRRAAAAQA